MDHKKLEKLNLMSLNDLTNMISSKIHQGGKDQKAKNIDLSEKPVKPTKDEVELNDFRGTKVETKVKLESRSNGHWSPKKDIFDVMNNMRYGRSMFESESSDSTQTIFTNIGSASANDAQYKFTRNNKEYEVEVYFPNENGNITLRVELNGKEIIREFPTSEDRNLEKHKNEIADELFKKEQDNGTFNGGSLQKAMPGMVGSRYNSNRTAFDTANPGNGEVTGNDQVGKLVSGSIFDSVNRSTLMEFTNPVFNKKRNLFEADAPESPEVPKPEENQEGANPGDVNSTSAIDTSAPMPAEGGSLEPMPGGSGSDLGSLGGGGGLGGLPDDAYSVHSQEGTEGADANAQAGTYDPDTIYGQLMTRYAKTAEGLSIPFVKGMAYLIGQNNYDAGVQYTQDPSQFMTGSAGILAKAPAVIIDKFFKMYPSFKDLPKDQRFEDFNGEGESFISAIEKAPQNGQRWFENQVSALYNQELGMNESDKAAFGNKDNDLFANFKPEDDKPEEQQTENAFPNLSGGNAPSPVSGAQGGGYNDLFGAANDFNKIGTAPTKQG